VVQPFRSACLPARSTQRSIIWLPFSIQEEGSDVKVRQQPNHPGAEQEQTSDRQEDSTQTRRALPDRAAPLVP